MSVLTGSHSCVLFCECECAQDSQRTLVANNAGNTTGNIIYNLCGALPRNCKQVRKKQARQEKFCSIYTLLLIELKRGK